MIRRLVGHIPKTKPLKTRIQELNYQLELYGRRHRINGSAIRSYSLSPLKRDVLFTHLLTASDSAEVVYDVGANTGDYSLQLAAKGRNVVCFEPDPRTFSKLKKNLSLNGFDDVQCYPFGVSDSQGKLTFYESSQPERSSFSEFNASYGSAVVTSTAEIEVVTLDQLVSDNVVPPPDHLKVDVEGFGYEVLSGAEDVIDTHQPIIYFEPHEISDGETRHRELMEFFDTYGYIVKKLDYPWVCRPQR